MNSSSDILEPEPIVTDRSNQLFPPRSRIGYYAGMKYTFNIQVSNDKNEYNEKLIVGALDNEGGATIGLKLLAYLIFIDRRPRIDEDAGWHFVPDLIARELDGTISLWIDCGKLSPKKVDTIAMKVRDKIDFYVFRKTERDMTHFYKTIEDKVKHLQNVKGVSFDDGFVDGIGGAIDRSNTIEGYIGDDMVNITIVNSFGKHEAYSTIYKVLPGSSAGDD